MLSVFNLTHFDDCLFIAHSHLPLKIEIIYNIMMSGALKPYLSQDSYVNLKMEEVIDPLFTLHEPENKNK